MCLIKKKHLENLNLFLHSNLCMKGLIEEAKFVISLIMFYAPRLIMFASIVF